MDDNRDKDLDKALGAGRNASDEQLAALVAQADLVKSELKTEPPAARHERALFVQGVAARSRSLRPVRFLVPAALGAAVLVTIGSLGRVALPGQTLYPIREALATVGLAKSSTEEVERRISDAREALSEASSLLEKNPDSARALAFTAIGELQRARRFLADVPGADRAGYLSSIGRLEDRAAVIVAAVGGEIDVTPSASPDPTDSPDDNSGPGGDDNSGPGGDDSSGPGSGDDSSGSGSGGDDDSSGSGSGGDDSSGSGSDGDDDNSGSGSDGDDSSGSGSGDSSGSDSGDSSGSGSGSGDSSGSGSDGGGDSSGSGSGGTDLSEKAEEAAEDAGEKRED